MEIQDGEKLQNGVRAKTIKRCGHFELIQYSEILEKFFSPYFLFQLSFQTQNFN
jgi:hypothetical protein